MALYGTGPREQNRTEGKRRRIEKKNVKKEEEERVREEREARREKERERGLVLVLVLVLVVLLGLAREKQHAISETPVSSSG
ncbi:hypothetical protein M0804_007193 [Polistes exclamans]|nr:hypothetical protein M0804_007193 [Polistes exclamans]